MQAMVAWTRRAWGEVGEDVEPHPRRVQGETVQEGVGDTRRQITLRGDTRSDGFADIACTDRQ